MFGSIQRGWALTKMSFRVISHDKELLLFPIFAGIGLLIALVGIGGLGYWMWHTTGLSDAAMVAIMLAYYFVSYFITIYFNTALVVAARVRLDGGDPNLGTGFRGANSRLGAILGWTLIAASVGIILQMLQNLARDERNIVGQILAQVAGYAWAAITYFVIPVFTAENVGPIEAIKRSAATMKRTWGEALTGHFGIGGIFFVLSLVGVLFLLLFGWVAAQPGLLYVGLAGVVLVILYFITLAVVKAAAGQVLVAALYRYAQTGDTGGFIPVEAAQNLFNPNADWSAYTDPNTGRVRGA